MNHETKPGDRLRVGILAYHGPRSCAAGVIVRDGAGRYYCDGMQCDDLADAVELSDALAARRDAMTA